MYIFYTFLSYLSKIYIIFFFNQFNSSFNTIIPNLFAMNTSQGAIPKQKRNVVSTVETRSKSKPSLNKSMCHNDLTPFSDSRSKVVHTPIRFSSTDPLNDLTPAATLEVPHPIDSIRDFNLRPDNTENLDQFRNLLDSETLRDSVTDVVGASSIPAPNRLPEPSLHSEASLQSYVTDCVKRSLDTFQNSLLSTLEDVLKKNLQESVVATVQNVMRNEQHDYANGNGQRLRYQRSRSGKRSQTNRESSLPQQNIRSAPSTTTLNPQVQPHKGLQNPHRAANITVDHNKDCLYNDHPQAMPYYHHLDVHRPPSDISRKLGNSF